jgi:signal transduction histidine kinase
MSAWLHQKLAFWFPAVGESWRSGLDRALVYANLRRQRVLVWVFISFHLAIISQSFLRKRFLFGSSYIGSGHLGIMLICVIILFGLGRPASEEEINRRYRLCEGVVFFLMILGMGLQISFLLPDELSIGPYILTVFLSAAFFYLPGPQLLALFGLAWSLLLAMVWRFSTEMHFPLEMVIIGTLCTLIAVIIARGTYVSFVNEFLSRMIIERNKQQQRELKTLNEISARLAHEFRNPLMSAGGFARRLFTSMSPEDPNRAKAEIIVKEVGRLETILRMILNYMKPLELNRSPIDPNQLVKAALQSMATEIEERKTRLDLQLDPELPEISADREFMTRVIKVLLKNAMNQMPDGATLSIATLQEDKMFKLVMRYPVLQMSSDGVEDFFYPFTTTRVAQDVQPDTVDLPKSKILVEKHGGQVNVGLQSSGEILVQVSLPLISV